MDLNKHIVKFNDIKPFHSSGIAQAASGDRLGSTGNVSFEQRQQIEKNKRLIGNYQRSSIGNPNNPFRVRIPTRKIIKIKLVPAQLSKQAKSVGGYRIVHPPGRHYDPFA